MATVKQHFIHFLKDNNVYEQYILNFNNRKKINKYYRETPFIKYFKITNETLLITNAFYWLSSPEHYYFWYILNKKWMHYLDNIKNNQEIIHYDFNKKIIYQIP